MRTTYCTLDADAALAAETRPARNPDRGLSPQQVRDLRDGIHRALCGAARCFGRGVSRRHPPRVGRCASRAISTVRAARQVSRDTRARAGRDPGQPPARENRK